MNLLPIPSSDQPGPARRRRMSALLGGVILGLGAMAALAGGVPQERQDNGQTQQREGQGRENRGQDGRSGWREPTEEEWAAAVEFLKEHNPQRLAIYEKALEEWRKEQPQPTTDEAEMPRNIRRARTIIFTRVHFLKQLAERDEDFYQFALGQFRLEDKIISHLMTARKAEEAGDEAAVVKALEEAEEAIRRYAEGTLDERAERIRRMREELDREAQRLEQDRSDLDKLVERLKERFERSLPGGDRNRDGDGDENDRDGRGEEQRGNDGQREGSGG